MKEKKEPCKECGRDEDDTFDPFDGGDLLDYHMDSEPSSEEIAKKFASAIAFGSKLGGSSSHGIDDELANLVNPKLSYRDFISNKIKKHQKNLDRNNWGVPKSKPMFAGLFIPKKHSNFVNMLIAYDCSGSMSQDDISLGISQILSVGKKCSGFLLPWDVKPYYDKMVPFKEASKSELKKAKVHGRGGTVLSELFDTYEKHCGRVDVMVVITDGYLYDDQLLSNLKIKNETDLVWLITSDISNFKPNIGKVFPIKD